MTSPNENSKRIKNVVFDVGNVIVRWSPSFIVESTFGAEADHNYYLDNIFKHQLWKELNLGAYTEDEVINAYLRFVDASREEMEVLFHHVKDSQKLIAGTVDLIKLLHAAGYPIYALTDNVHEIVSSLKSRYDFWDYFTGAVVSAEVGMLKPEPPIFKHLLDTHELQAEQTVFIDDHPPNVQGAKTVGIEAIQFIDADQCHEELQALGLIY